MRTGNGIVKSMEPHPRTRRKLHLFLVTDHTYWLIYSSGKGCVECGSEAGSL